MANTTFSGPVRSETTLKTISKDSTTGTITEVTTIGDGPVSLSDGDVTLTNATHSGRVLLVPDGTQDNTYTLPAPIAGSVFKFVYAVVQQMPRTRSSLLRVTQTTTLVELPFLILTVTQLVAYSQTETLTAAFS